MQSFEGNLEHFDPRNPYAGDEKLPIQFYMGVIKDDDATERENRPIYKDVESIRIYNSKDNIVDRPVRDSDKQRWPRQYQGWKLTDGAASEIGAAGTKLEVWPQMTRAQVEEFKYFKIFTVEQLAEIPDTQAQKIMGISRLKALAQAFVEAAKGGAPIMRLQLEIEARDGVINELKSAYADLKAKFEEFTKKAA